jgi:hypothetical protein
VHGEIDGPVLRAQLRHAPGERQHQGERPEGLLRLRGPEPAVGVREHRALGTCAAATEWKGACTPVYKAALAGGPPGTLIPLFGDPRSPIGVANNTGGGGKK